MTVRVLCTDLSFDDVSDVYDYIKTFTNDDNASTHTDADIILDCIMMTMQTKSVQYAFDRILNNTDLITSHFFTVIVQNDLLTIRSHPRP